MSFIIYFNCKCGLTGGNDTTTRHCTQAHISHKGTQHAGTKHNQVEAELEFRINARVSSNTIINATNII